MFKDEAWLYGAIVFIAAFCIGVLGLSGSYAQAVPLEPASDITAARDAKTFQNDLSLTNRCIEAGETKAECICVTRILKYELNLRDYKIAAQLYPFQISTTQKDVNASLLKAGYKTHDIDHVVNITRGLTQASDFQSRCQDSQLYFSGAQQN